MDARRVVEGLDKLNIEGKEQEGAEYLEFWLEQAIAERDERSELTILSEMLGQYRRCQIKDKGLDACKKAIDMVYAQSLDNTATGATILINAATTMRAFGETEDALPIFEKCLDVYNKTLSENDYRMSALYNNMATAYEDLKDYSNAEISYKKALELLSKIDNSSCDQAVTYCSLAELYTIWEKDESLVNECMEKAWELLSTNRRDTYLSFTISKCLHSFDYFGFFIYAKKLREIKESIDELYR